MRNGRLEILELSIELKTLKMNLNSGEKRNDKKIVCTKCNLKVSFYKYMYMYIFAMKG